MKKIGWDNLIAWLAIVFLFGAIVRTAWVAEDAYITARVLDNVLLGYGPVWNTFERVQVFTHPLWMFLWLPFYTLWRDPLMSNLVLSFLCSGAALWLLARTLSPVARIVFAVTLFSSPTWVDFSTSGLENPLLHLLFAMFFLISYRGFDVRRASVDPLPLVLLHSLGALLACTRNDAILLVFPVLLCSAASFFTSRGFRSLFILLGAWFPFWGWTFFSLVYYGFPFPNTAYAKLATGISSLDISRQGVLYYFRNLVFDPALVITIACFLLSFLMISRRKNSSVLFFFGVGILLYCLYVVRIGGDFMYGRFLSSAFLLSAYFMIKEIYLRGTLAVRVGFFLVAFALMVLSDPLSIRLRRGLSDGIANEKAYYYDVSSLESRLNGRNILQHPFSEAAFVFRASDEMVIHQDYIGMFGYLVGPEKRIIDGLALSDPLLARMPVEKKWRIGHYRRKIPEGYLEAVRTVQPDKIKDVKIRSYYKDIVVVTQGPLWSMERWSRIWRLNTRCRTYRECEH